MIWFSRRRTSHGSAAFANAVLLSGRVQGDSHPCGHLGGVVIPATLASAERAGIAGKPMFSALVAAYEVALRTGRDHAAEVELDRVGRQRVNLELGRTSHLPGEVHAAIGADPRPADVPLDLAPAWAGL